MIEKHDGDYPVLITIDPGKATGVTISYLPEENPTTLSGISATEVFSFEDMAAVLWRLGTMYRKTGSMIVIENFIIGGGTAAKTQAPWSLELIGAAKMTSVIWHIGFCLQTPALAKSTASDKLLHKMARHAPGWWTPTEGGHANDALRHAATWLLRNNRVPMDVMRELVDNA